MTLGKRYDEVMKHVEVTPEMRRRILRNIEQADLTEAAPRKVVRSPLSQAACDLVRLPRCRIRWGLDPTRPIPKPG